MHEIVTECKFILVSIKKIWNLNKKKESNSSTDEYEPSKYTVFLLNSNLQEKYKRQLILELC